MQSTRKLLFVISIIGLIILAGCGNSSEESKTESNNETSTNHSAESEPDEDANKSSKETDENQTESAPDQAEKHDQETSSENSASSTSDEKTTPSSENNSEAVEDTKENYLKKLNEMEEADKNKEAKTTITEMEEQEEARYKNWDKTLNEIYSVLKEQLSTKNMDKLKEEQRQWVEHRTETAKEASLEYEGGSTEALEYVATQASLTKERCYTLVANYME